MAQHDRDAADSRPSRDSPEVTPATFDIFPRFPAELQQMVFKEAVHEPMVQSFIVLPGHIGDRISEHKDVPSQTLRLTTLEWFAKHVGRVSVNETLPAPSGYHARQWSSAASVAARKIAKFELGKTGKTMQQPDGTSVVINTAADVVYLKFVDFDDTDGVVHSRAELHRKPHSTSVHDDWEPFRLKGRLDVLDQDTLPLLPLLTGAEEREAFAGIRRVALELNYSLADFERRLEAVNWAGRDRSLPRGFNNAGFANVLGAMPDLETVYFVIRDQRLVERLDAYGDKRRWRYRLPGTQVVSIDDCEDERHCYETFTCPGGRLTELCAPMIFLGAMDGIITKIRHWYHYGAQIKGDEELARRQKVQYKLMRWHSDIDVKTLLTQKSPQGRDRYLAPVCKGLYSDRELSQ
ncbi:hypothetical protein B0T19DRAFT_443297 [Cercophora scortea]|uniref:Uncharacterized protein n=1 Tax=Cercophora scortea TaxID=314031 RepID=A0AAE0IEU4_9PEZI|nr:hypothetical protein B0T19DRAFT_443297 [Cercophora scortea]